jgi:hypothetical protein
MLAPKQKPDEQDEGCDGCAGACGEQPSDRQRVGAAGRIVAVAQQPDVIGQCPDRALSGVDERQTKARGLDR